ncbi:MAG: DNA-binding protein [Bacteroidetes bacterium 4572_128]|nr:MAG: DNA-binding protein [Bacteroidetes bacterium 4572_128]
MEEYDKKSNKGKTDREEIFSRTVRAGKRTYFFDVKATRRGEYYLTITESKKRFDKDGRFHFEKHKVFLYKEDFDKFADGLNDVIEFIQTEQGFDEVEEEIIEELEENDKKFTDVDFEDLEETK